MTDLIGSGMEAVEGTSRSGASGIAAAGRLNELGQPVGEPVPGWAGAQLPRREPMEGRYGRVVPLEAEAHAAALHEANSLDAEGRNWTYLLNEPFPTFESYRSWLKEVEGGSDPMFYTVLDAEGAPVGIASYLRIAPVPGSIEVGHIHFSRRLQQTRLATEAMYLMMRNAFGLGYRRYEWKCDALNAPSRRAAQRLGFSYEGIFRQALVYKGRNRDTAWYAAIDSEWPHLDAAYQRWLHPDNFDERGRQRERLSELTRPVLARIG